MSNRLLYIIVVTAVILWCLGFIGGADLNPESAFTANLKAMYGRVCHQIPDRSFAFAEHPWFVCHRCSAIYLSFLAGTLLLPLLRRPIPWISISRRHAITALAPMAVDGILDLFGLHGSSMVLRLLTGSLAGFGLSWLVVPLLIESLSQLAYRHSHLSGEHSHARKAV